MSTLQIRAMPYGVKRILKTRAAAAGQSLSEYALAELQQCIPNRSGGDSQAAARGFAR
jgi:plasmid stability protein